MDSDPPSLRSSGAAEAALLARCRRGEPDAWDELFDLHYAAAGRFIFQLSHDFTREDAEEICQEVFLSVIKNLGSFQGESRFQTWLFRIAANQARDYREKRNAAKRGGGITPVSLQAEDPETGLALDPPADAPGPDDWAMNAEQMAGVRGALDRVGETCREILELRYFGDLSYEELSATLNLNPKTVSSRLSKCLDRLEEIAREMFARENPGVFPSN
jgi:RNA polymerase sigma-70 factor (ECF subfamily)